MFAQTVRLKHTPFRWYVPAPQMEGGAGVVSAGDDVEVDAEVDVVVPAPLSSPLSSSAVVVCVVGGDSVVERVGEGVSVGVGAEELTLTSPSVVVGSSVVVAALLAVGLGRNVAVEVGAATVLGNAIGTEEVGVEGWSPDIPLSSPAVVSSVVVVV